ncbi:MAG: hypothetical protein A2408_01660 [Candidatus Yonathbacteria bacterium RIFOXYC1_FULL_52_10]|uniref:Uncharacterized protein n=1 Tax=Candidatus Yonathbacteria bacterium RIFOXYD1_FULL_52_36 TaxID=1802730 RepID=A0A1G2SI74_9BACT|nr:MAG: hypothetical protein A2591_03390 [Candidatus Yonathbacteria bacterium RIFOXYD1_FULL_52_36]OHA84815.1 MAG: hypothetical protein A2408_01660 [Candidatus Yonathbacteria bacterium RIFOXYC1_FULL_52_10]
MNPMSVRALNHPVGWALLARKSAEKNRLDALYRIVNCEILYDQVAVPFDSPEKVRAVLRTTRMFDLLSQRGLFVAKDGSLGLYQALGKGVPAIDLASLSVEYNSEMLSSHEVQQFEGREHVPGMTLCTIDMVAFEQAIKNKATPPLLITSIGWWGSDQSKE